MAKNPAVVPFKRYMDLAVRAGYKDDHPFVPAGGIDQTMQLIFIKFVHLVAAAFENSESLMLSHIEELAVEAGYKFYEMPTTGTVDTMKMLASSHMQVVFFRFTGLIAEELGYANPN